jgi:general secretion pathway protein E
LIKPFLEAALEPETTPSLGEQGLLTQSESAFLGHLISKGHIKSKDGERILTFVGESSTSLVGAITQLGMLAERQLALLMSEFLDLPLVAPPDYPDRPALSDGPSLRYLKKHGIVPIRLTDASVELAVINPFDLSISEAFRLLLGTSVEIGVAVPVELEAAQQRLYGGGRTEVDEILIGMDSGSSLNDSEAQRLKELASEAPIVRLLNAVIARAVERDASDIHIESYETSVSIRYRIDGVLQDAESPSQQIGPALTSRIKILARLNIAERRLPQDGRIKLPVLGKLIDFRVSIVPTLHGERIVLRILDHDHGPQVLSSLGMRHETLEGIERILKRPNGMVLVTGPTGSGKTTTLYAALQALPFREKNVITVEDPIEYQIDGVNQIQVKPSIGLGFASVLRSILRQDPDVIMVGEIRDPETASIAVHAALTGHLVLSTLHTSSAAGAVTRLLDMGIQGYLLVSALEGVLAQRLVRRLCESCKVETLLSSEEASSLGDGSSANPVIAKVFRPRGCAKCGNTGYRGRTVVTDLLVVDESVRSLVMRGASSREIEASSRRGRNVLGLRGDGLRLVAEGITSFEEVSAVIAGMD